MFTQQQRKLKRSAKLITVLSKYGFQDLLMRILPGEKFDQSVIDSTKRLTTFERIRLALEELGPTFVKLGQTFSNREDMLPQELILQLQQLQDHVEVLNLDIFAIIEEELGFAAKEAFLSIDETPIAAASIAQVYKGKLLDGSDVILKVKRPGIDTVIKDDLLLLKDLVQLIYTYSDFGEKISLKHAVLAFERSLLEELSLKIELENIQKFAHNYQHDSTTYVPKVYSELSTNNLLTMEFIDGTKIIETEVLESKGLDPVYLSEVGYRLYVSQILDHGFFHADPHAGNLLVKDNGQLVFIDFGAVGKIPETDKDLLENLILSLMRKKSNKIVRYLKRMAIEYKIPNEQQFENDVEEIITYIHGASLKEINIAEIIDRMKHVLVLNRLIMPDYFYLLFKGITLMDGVGRRINPGLDVIESLKPYTEKLFLKKLQPDYIAKKAWKQLEELADNMEEVPKELRTVLHQLAEKQLTIRTNDTNFERMDYLIKSSVTNLILGFVLAANMIGTCILFASNAGPSIGIFPILPILSLLFSFGILVILVIRILRR